MAVLPAPPINWGGDPPQSVAGLVSGGANPIVIPSSQTFIPAPVLTGSGGGGGGQGGYPVVG